MSTRTYLVSVCRESRNFCCILMFSMFHLCQCIHRLGLSVAHQQPIQCSAVTNYPSSGIVHQSKSDSKEDSQMGCSVCDKPRQDGISKDHLLAHLPIILQPHGSPPGSKKLPNIIVDIAIISLIFKYLDYVYKIKLC